MTLETARIHLRQALVSPIFAYQLDVGTEQIRNTEELTFNVQQKSIAVQLI